MWALVVAAESVEEEDLEQTHRDHLLMQVVVPSVAEEAMQRSIPSDFENPADPRTLAEEGP